MAKAIIVILMALISSVCVALPVASYDSSEAPQMQYNTGLAGYGANESGWLFTLFLDIEFEKPKPVQQFFRQTHFEVKSKQSVEPVSNNLLLAVDDTFNNPLLTLRANAVSEPSLLLLMLLGFIYLMQVKRCQLIEK